jgi:hypothetical protein
MKSKSWSQRQIDRLHIVKERMLFSALTIGRDSLKRLSDLKGSQDGRRCFIIGNGPSLRKTDLSLLRDEYTFGLNRIYLLFPVLGFTTSCIVSVNTLVIEQCVTEILAQGGVKFLPWGLRRYFPKPVPKDLVMINTEAPNPIFQQDACRPLWQGATVTFVAMQLAYHMGFKQVILVGVDHSFSTMGKAHTEVVSQGDDPNHFSVEYFGKGFRWHLPDLQTSEIAYHMARRAFEAEGREIVDATIGGKLTVFPKVDYSSLF